MRVRAGSRIALVGAIALACLAVVVASPDPAWACSCGGITDADAFEQADAVFVAQVVQDDEVTQLPEMAEPSRDRWVFEVSEVFKGDVAERQVAVSEPHGASCGLELWQEGPYLVFASRGSSSPYKSEPGPGELYVGLCMGSRSLGTSALPASFGEPSPPAVVEPAPASSGGLPTAAVITLAIGAVALAAAATAVVVSRTRRPG